MMVARPPIQNHSGQDDDSIERETITLRATESGQAIDVLVLDKRADRIHIMLDEGTHSVFCELKPTQSALTYVGNAMGREIVYERSRVQVQADIDGDGRVLSDPNPQ